MTTYEKICPLYGLNQHFQECWHDSLLTTCFFTDGIGDIIQKIFNDYKIKDINKRIRNNIRYKRIPDYYLPINIENKKEDLIEYYLNCYEYIKNLHTIYNRIKSYNESLERETPIEFKSYETYSYSCIKNMYNMYNINKIEKDVYTINKHYGILPHYLIQLNTINYLFMNFFRKSKEINPKIEYIYPEIIDFKFYINLIAKNFKQNYNYITNLVFHLGRILELLPTSLGVIITSYDKDKYKEKYFNHDQSFITCNNIDYFYDNNGINDEVEYITTVQFQWRRYLEKKIKFIINEINIKFINKTDYSKEKLIALIEIIESISDLFKNHHNEPEFPQVGKKILETTNIYSLLFIFKTN